MKGMVASFITRIRCWRHSHQDHSVCISAMCFPRKRQVRYATSCDRCLDGIKWISRAVAYISLFDDLSVSSQVVWLSHIFYILHSLHPYKDVSFSASRPEYQSQFRRRMHYFFLISLWIWERPTRDSDLILPIQDLIVGLRLRAWRILYVL